MAASSFFFLLVVFFWAGIIIEVYSSMAMWSSLHMALDFAACELESKFVLQLLQERPENKWGKVDYILVSCKTLFLV